MFVIVIVIVLSRGYDCGADIRVSYARMVVIVIVIVLSRGYDRRVDIRVSYARIGQAAFSMWDASRLAIPWYGYRGVPSAG